jgi:NAD(P)-dependent dehydrogenase (short-subunit alcohol dehydrogenase family)
MLKGKNIVIIGGTSGIGLAAAKKMIDHGAKVLVTGKEDAEATKAEGEIQKNGKVLMVDAREEGTAEKVIEACELSFGAMQGLFHVAGGSGRKFGDGPLHSLTLEGWEYTLSLNLTSLMLSNRAAIRYFLEKKTPGALLNLGSVLGRHPSPTYFATHAYATSKAAIEGFSTSIAAYYAPHNIRVNVITPGLVATPMAQRAAADPIIQTFIKSKQPLDKGRMGAPEDISALACLLLSDQSQFITGQCIAVDGGWSVSEGQYQGDV